MAMLTPKRRRFIEAYLQTWNASEAARQAGFKHPGQQGEALLKKLEVKAAIQERMAEMTMQTDEDLKRLTDQARLNAAMFFDFEPNDQGEIKPTINWEIFQTYGHLIKKLSYNRQGQPMLEFHDAQKALELIGRAQGLFQEKSVDVNVHISLDEWRAEREKRLSQAKEIEE